MQPSCVKRPSISDRPIAHERDGNGRIDRADPRRIRERVEDAGQRTGGAAQIAGRRPRGQRRAIGPPGRTEQLEVALVEEVPADQRAQHDEQRPAARALMRLATSDAAMAADHERLRRRVVVGRHQREHVCVMPAQIASRELEPADEERRGQARRRRPRCRDDARAQHALRRPARARIEHVAVAAAVDIEELLAGAARAERARRAAGRAQAARSRRGDTRSIGQPRSRPPIASTLLRPAESSACCTPPRGASPRCDRARSPCRWRRGSARRPAARSARVARSAIERDVPHADASPVPPRSRRLTAAGLRAAGSPSSG